MAKNMAKACTFKYADGEEYIGEWNDENRHDEGSCKYASGNVCAGEWMDNKKHGQDTGEYANGGEYVGEWKVNKKMARAPTRIMQKCVHRRMEE